MSQSTEKAERDATQSSAAERFLGAIEAEAVLPPHVTPVEAAVVAVSALFDRLTAGQAHQVVTALPAEVRPLFERSYEHRTRRPVVRIGRAELVDRVAEQLGVAPVSAEIIVAAVFHALASILPREQIAHVAQQLPHDLQDLWLSPIPALTEDVGLEPELLRQLLGDIERSVALPARVSARAAFASVMCLFAERLSGGEARHLLLGLPRTVRPLVARCLVDRRERSLTFDSAELTAHVAADLGLGLEEAGSIIAAVFAAVGRILPHEELEHVASQLPEDLRSLWSA
jgi:uncharacterized protein (DUF2267 family)